MPLGSKALPPCSCVSWSPGPLSATAVSRDPLVGCAVSEARSGVAWRVASMEVGGWRLGPISQRPYRAGRLGGATGRFLLDLWSLDLSAAVWVWRKS
jgi:hypothetical protein